MRPVSDLQRKVSPFQVISDYVPAGDQPVAIEEIARRINDGVQDVVLLGATGTGKSATTAWLVEKLQRPTLVLAPNKLLAAQLANEFKELCRIMQSSTLFRITTTTSQRPMFLRPIPLLKKTPALMMK
jgi:excinuclease ABC subunit B